jgi:transcriptional regulator with XRE-family HTH domain
MTTRERFLMQFKKLRAVGGMTQEALAEKAGISRTYVARLELCQQDPTLRTLEMLAKYSGS